VNSDHYATLGVSPDAPPEVIRAAYKVLAQKHHPDRNTAKEAEAITSRINEAYGVLSDPEKRSVYDAQRAAEARSTAVNVRAGGGANTAGDFTKRSVQTASVEAEGTKFSLRFIPAQITLNEMWHETQMPKGPRRGPIAIFQQGEVIARQRIGVLTPRGSSLVENTGSHIPLGLGQEVEIVQAYTADNSKEGFVAIINRSAGQWFWIGSRAEAGKVVRSTEAQILDMLLYAGVLASVGGLCWLLLRHNLLLLMAAFFFGLPILTRVLMPLQGRTADKLGVAMGRKIHSVANGGRSP